MGDQLIMISVSDPARILVQYLLDVNTRNSSGDEIAKRDLMIDIVTCGPITVRLYDKTYRRCHFSVYLFILQLYK